MNGLLTNKSCTTSNTTKILICTACSIALLFAYLFSAAFYLQLLIYLCLLFLQRNVLKAGFSALCDSPNTETLITFSAVFALLHGVASHQRQNLFFYVAGILTALEFLKIFFTTERGGRGIADKLSKLILLSSMLMAAVCATVNIIGKTAFSEAMVRVFSVLTVACAPSVVLITPAFSAAALRMMAKCKITACRIDIPEKLGNVKELIVEQRGIVTDREYRLYDVYSVDNDRYGLLSVAFAIESNFFHPVAKAVCAAAYSAQITPKLAHKCFEISGKGVGGTVGGDKYLIGTKRLLREKGISLPDAVLSADYSGCMPLYVAKNCQFYGMLFFACKKIAGCEDIFNKIGALGIRRIIIADGEREDVRKSADILLTEKEKVLQELKNGAKIKAMTVTEKSLISADVCATAFDTSADIVLGNSAMYGTLFSLILGKTTRLCIKAAIVSAVLISLAFATFFAFGGTPISVLLLIFCVLPLAYVAVILKTVPLEITVSEEEEMFKKVYYTLKINGMSCTHCSARVKTALESLRGVSAEVSLEDKCARVKCSASVSAENLEKAVTDAGFTVVSVESV